MRDWAHLLSLYTGGEVAPLVLISSVSDVPLFLWVPLHPENERVVCKSCPKIGSLLASGKEDVIVSFRRPVGAW